MLTTFALQLRQHAHSYGGRRTALRVRVLLQGVFSRQNYLTRLFVPGWDALNLSGTL